MNSLKRLNTRPKMEALKQLNMPAEVTKVEDIEEMMKYNVLTTPVLVIDEVIRVKGRVVEVNEIKQLLTA